MRWTESEESQVIMKAFPIIEDESAEEIFIRICIIETLALIMH